MAFSGFRSEHLPPIGACGQLPARAVKNTGILIYTYLQLQGCKWELNICITAKWADIPVAHCGELIIEVIMYKDVCGANKKREFRLRLWHKYTRSLSFPKSHFCIAIRLLAISPQCCSVRLSLSPSRHCLSPLLKSLTTSKMVGIRPYGLFTHRTATR